MRVSVLQVSVGPDQAIGGEDHLVPGLLELLQQLLRTRGENHVVAGGGGREKASDALQRRDSEHLTELDPRTSEHWPQRKL